MKSRLQGRLESDIANATNPLSADCLRCELAAYFARLGDFDEAARGLAEVQARYAARPHAAISAWSSLADGLITHYTDMGALAIDKMKRAHAMSAAVGLQAAQVLSAAWLAYFACLKGDAAATTRYASEALKLARPDHHAARARVGLALAHAYHASGRFDLARPRYEAAQRHATTEGDDTTLSAILWTMASLRVANMRQALACGQGAAPAFASGAGGDHVLLSCESTATFDKLKGLRSLPAHQPMLRAQVCMLFGRIDEALPLYEKHLAAALRLGMRSVQGNLLADRAWCRLQAGQEKSAREDAVAANEWLESASEAEAAFGDRAPGHSRLACFFEALNDQDSARHHEQAAATAWKRHAKNQANMIEGLDREFANSCSAASVSSTVTASAAVSATSYAS